VTLRTKLIEGVALWIEGPGRPAGPEGRLFIRRSSSLVLPPSSRTQCKSLAKRVVRCREPQGVGDQSVADE